MQRKEEIVWGNGEGVEKSLKRMLENEKVLDQWTSSSPQSFGGGGTPPLEKVKYGGGDDGGRQSPDSEIKMKQFMEAMATKNDYMKENQFIEGFFQNNDRDLVNSRLSERRLFSDGIKNPFMVDADYSRDMDNASKYIKFGKK